ncbi:hypothetical protein MNBD_NITROSPINAE03-2031 [hydrothermal vent metagenome]|uniref:Uncharacterized protein n=1 Tax=hydrothermal vent metagenome TaxID=652676 RepID=A0A3B1CE27_9ZZZZ
MRTVNVLVKALFISVSVSFFAFVSIAGVAHADNVVEVAIDSAPPQEGYADVIIEASVAKPDDEWGSRLYRFDFVIDGRRFSHKVKKNVIDAEATKAMARFAVKLRIRFPEGKRVIKFDSLEKFRPLVTSAVFEGGKVSVIEFRPEYKSVKGKIRVEYTAWMEGKKLPLRYERFNLH